MTEAPVRPEEDYLAHLAQGPCMLLRSRSTGEHLFYPRVATSRSGTRDLERVEASGRGTAHAATVMRPRPPATPYDVSLIDLEDGPRMMSRVAGLDPAQERPDMKAQARIDACGDEPLPVFDVER